MNTKVNRAGIAMLLTIIGVGAIAAATDHKTTEPGHALPTQTERDAISASAAAEIRSRGWHCPEITSFKHTETRSDGSTVSRISCGGRGPYYLYVSRGDGHGLLVPVN